MAGPSTPFETNGGTAYTTYSQGETFLDNVVAGSSLAKKYTLGITAQGRPITAIVLGNPNAADLGSLVNCAVVVASQHGTEKSPREAAFMFLRDMAYNASSSDLARLSSLPIVVIPTANPDGVENNSRANSLGVDLNRDHLALTQVETKAIAEILRSKNCLLVYDGHEATVASYQINSAFYATGAASPIKAFSSSINSAMTAEFTDYTYGPYASTDNEGTLQSSSTLRGYPYILVECLDSQAASVKVQQHYRSMLVTYRFIADNISSAQTTITEAKQDYKSQGQEAYVPWYGYETITLPSRYGYWSSDLTKINQLRLLGAEVHDSGDVDEGFYVSSNQPSAQIIALVMDPSAPRASVPSVPLFSGFGFYEGTDINSVTTMPGASLNISTLKGEPYKIQIMLSGQRYTVAGK